MLVAITSSNRREHLVVPLFEIVSDAEKVIDDGVGLVRYLSKPRMTSQGLCKQLRRITKGRLGSASSTEWVMVAGFEARTLRERPEIVLMLWWPNRFWEHLGGTRCI